MNTRYRVQTEFHAKCKMVSLKKIVCPYFRPPKFCSWSYPLTDFCVICLSSVIPFSMFVLENVYLYRLHCALTFYPCLFYSSDKVWHSRCASVRAFHTFLDQTTIISCKVRAPRRVRSPRRLSASGAPNDVPNCHLDKTNMDNSSMWGGV